MHNIWTAEERIKKYLTDSFSRHYNFDVYKKAIIAEETRATEVSDLFDFVDKKFKCFHATTKIIASENRWEPCCMVNYEWKVKKSTLNVQVTLVAGDVRFVSIQDSFSVKKKFGDEFDFASEFEKSIALLNSLRE